jgi:hypothetical protein
MNGLPCQDAELKAEKKGGWKPSKKCLKNWGAKNTRVNTVIQLSLEEILSILSKLTTQK